MNQWCYVLPYRVRTRMICILSLKMKYVGLSNITVEPCARQPRVDILSARQAAQRRCHRFSAAKTVSRCPAWPGNANLPATAASNTDERFTLLPPRPIPAYRFPLYTRTKARLRFRLCKQTPIDRSSVGTHVSSLTLHSHLKRLN